VKRPCEKERPWSTRLNSEIPLSGKWKVIHKSKDDPTKKTGRRLCGRKEVEGCVVETR
jgi:hypothetical protein